MVETAQLLPDPAAAAAVAAGQWPEGEEPPKPRVVAVKRLKANILESEDDVFSFITEARLLIRLQHPSIVEDIGLGCADASSQEAQWRTMYLVQEVGGPGWVAGGGDARCVVLEGTGGCGGGKCLTVSGSTARQALVMTCCSAICTPPASLPDCCLPACLPACLPPRLPACCSLRSAAH